ncbi:MAG: hypothetical protein ACJAVR_000781 [Paracoccaceae bacterium]
MVLRKNHANGGSMTFGSASVLTLGLTPDAYATALPNGTINLVPHAMRGCGADP